MATEEEVGAGGPTVRAPPAAGRGELVLLVGLSALAPLSLQIFLPALPAIQRHFEVTPGVAQLTLSLSILANAVATLAFGPLSDRFGRRPILLSGLVTFVIGSGLAAIAPTIELLIAARILQSVGGAAGMVLARAIVRDLYEREKAASVIAYMTTAMVVVPMLAPVLGAVLVDVSGWRSIFGVVVLAGLLLAWQAYRRLRETRRAGTGAGGWTGVLSGAVRLIGLPAFWAYVLQSTFAISVFFAFISGAPYFVIDILGRPATEYGLYFIMVSAGYMAGNLVAARYAQRVGVDRLITIGATGALMATILAFALLLGLAWTPITLFGPMVLGAFSNGLSMPNAQAGVISVDPLLAGTASGVAGFLQMTAAAAGFPGRGHAPERHALSDGGLHGRLCAALAAGLRRAAAAGTACARLSGPELAPGPGFTAPARALAQPPQGHHLWVVGRGRGLVPRRRAAVNGGESVAPAWPGKPRPPRGSRRW